MSRPKSARRSLHVLGRFAVRFAPELRAQRGLIGLALLALAGQTAFRLLEPWPLSLVIDRIVKQATADGWLSEGIVRHVGTTELVLLAAVATVAVAVGRAACAYLSTVGFALIGNRLLTEVRDALFRHLQRLSPAFFANARGGDVVVRVIQDVGMLKETTVTALLPLLGNALILAGMLALMLWLHWQLALIVLAVLPAFALTAVPLGRRIHAQANKQRRRESDMAATAAESIGAIKTVQVLALADFFSAGFARSNRRSLKEGVKGARLSASLERAVDVIVAAAAAVVLWRGAVLVLRQQLTPGELLVFLFYLRQALRPMRDFAKYTARLSKAAAGGQRVMALFDHQPDVVDRPGAVAARSLRGELCFDGVVYGYDPAHPVLRGLSLHLAPGERVALVGASGGGKSTLIGLAVRLFEPQAGCVRVDGRDVRDYTLQSLRGQMSVILQEPLLFAASIRDNIAYGAEEVSDAQVAAAARLAGVEAFIDDLPDGYDTVVGERGVKLSAGQRQRIAIARAAVRGAPILLFDEPVTGLDEENARLVEAALMRLSQDRTTLLVTHDLALAARMERVVVLSGGVIVEDGSPGELQARDGAYAALAAAARPVPPGGGLGAACA